MTLTNAIEQPAFNSSELEQLLQRQKSAFLKDGFPSAEIRIDRLDRIIDIHKRYKDKLLDALYADFNTRPRLASLASDVIATINDAKETKKLIRRWMKPEKKKVPLLLKLTGASAEVQFQPLGVIGNISPWNFPAQLAFSPAIGAFGAGNRMMLKPSEAVPQTSELMKEMVESAFDEEEFAVVTGDIEVGQAFSALPFDHLVFTGGPSIAKHVMAAAAQNLVPVTLELGGKCPVVVGDSADLEMVAKRVMTMKCMNSGQLCLTPDYIFLPKGRTEEFVAEAKKVLGEFYTSLLDNDDYASIISKPHWERLNGYLTELKEKNVRTEVFNPANEDFSAPHKNKLPITFVMEPGDDVKIMQDEIFGPMLSVKSYDNIDEVVDFVNNKPRPLALYYFGKNNSEIDKLCKQTTSGGVTINDVAQHVAVPDLPLAGVGNSGMGAYHGHYGFLEFSHQKAVLRQGKLSLGQFMRPPFTEKKEKMFNKMA